MGSNYRKQLIALFTFLGGLYFVFEFAMPESYLKEWGIAEKHEAISLGFVAIGLVTFGLGIINLGMIHGSRIAFQRKGWPNSLALLFGLGLMLAVSFYDWMIDFEHEKAARDVTVLSEFARHIVESEALPERPKNLPPLETRLMHLEKLSLSVLADNRKAFVEAPDTSSDASVPDAVIARSNIVKSLESLSLNSAALQAASGNAERLEKAKAIAAGGSELAFLKRQYAKAFSQRYFGKRLYDFLFDGLFVNLGSAIFSLLGIYIAAAAYRAFRVRSMESSLMMISALLVMLGQIPFGLWLYDGMPEIRSWLLEVPNTAASRAITIGALVASLVLAFRMWFSIESDKFSEDDK